MPQAQHAFYNASAGPSLRARRGHSILHYAILHYAILRYNTIRHSTICIYYNLLYYTMCYTICDTIL